MEVQAKQLHLAFEASTLISGLAGVLQLGRVTPEEVKARQLALSPRLGSIGLRLYSAVLSWSSSSIVELTPKQSECF